MPNGGVQLVFVRSRVAYDGNPRSSALEISRRLERRVPS
jgi:hypothetical protein